jgi:hypothetical protein
MLSTFEDLRSAGAVEEGARAIEPPLWTDSVEYSEPAACRARAAAVNRDPVHGLPHDAWRGGGALNGLEAPRERVQYVLVLGVEPAEPGRAAEPTAEKRGRRNVPRVSPQSCFFDDAEALVEEQTEQEKAEDRKRERIVRGREG